MKTARPLVPLTLRNRTGFQSGAPSKIKIFQVIIHNLSTHQYEWLLVLTSHAVVVLIFGL